MESASKSGYFSTLSVRISTANKITNKDPSKVANIINVGEGNSAQQSKSTSSVVNIPKA